MRNATSYAFTGLLAGLVAPTGLVIYARLAGEIPDLRLVFGVLATGGSMTLAVAGWMIGRRDDAIRHHSQELSVLSTQLRELSATDGLTGIPNRRSFDERLGTEMALATRYGSTVSLVMADLDLFKQLNDQHGHTAGDAVLRAVAQQMDRQKRAGDLVARYGGEEFVAILPHTTATAAAAWADRVRRAIEAAQIGITASFGVAQIAPGWTAKQMIEGADAALYRAKRAGRNRVEIFGGAPRLQSVC
jgi:diguanylate cyclase (GGDEF)-like protein